METEVSSQESYLMSSFKGNDNNGKKDSCNSKHQYNNNNNNASTNENSETTSRKDDLNNNNNINKTKTLSLSSSHSSHNNFSLKRNEETTPVTTKRVKLHTDYSDVNDGSYYERRKHDHFDNENDPFLGMPPDAMDLLYVPKNCAESVEQFAKYVWETGWKAMPHHALPNWLRDNDFLLKGHRPPLPSIKACFKSVFRIHTETGNIWTHFIGALSFLSVAIYFLSRPNIEINIQEKVIFGFFFIGAIVCLLCSALFHTFYCYSPRVSKIFSKIDYCGISVLTMGSFVPWLFYAFYCEPIPKIAYLVLIAILGISCIVVSLWDKFSEPEFRAIRAGMFIALGLSGLIPAIHYSITFGSYKAFNVGALGWLILMAVLYIAGATLYACRIPERLFPGKFDIWFQSHQIFHVFVVAAAYVHYHGITKLASYRLTLGDCLAAYTEADFSFEF